MDNPFISLGYVIESRIGLVDGPEYGGPFRVSDKNETFFLKATVLDWLIGVVNALV